MTTSRVPLVSTEGYAVGNLGRNVGQPCRYQYMLGHWVGLTVFLEDGRIEVDTNTVERTMRPIALGRKNALFAGSDSGARTWAILASLINTAKLNDLDPHTYLADVLERMISGRTPVNRLDELLAWNWKAARAALATAA